MQKELHKRPILQGISNSLYNQIVLEELLEFPHVDKGGDSEVPILQLWEGSLA